MPMAGHPPHYLGAGPAPTLHGGRGQGDFPPSSTMAFSVSGLPQTQQLPSVPAAPPYPGGPPTPQLAATSVVPGSGQGRGPLPPVGPDQLASGFSPPPGSASGQVGHPGVFPSPLPPSSPHPSLQQCPGGGAAAPLGGLLQSVQPPPVPSTASLPSQQPSFVSSGSPAPPQLAPPGGAPSSSVLTQTLPGVAFPFAPPTAQQHEQVVRSVAPHPLPPPSSGPQMPSQAAPAPALPSEQLDSPFLVNTSVSAPALMAPSISGSVSPAARSQLSMASDTRPSAVSASGATPTGPPIASSLDPTAASAPFPHGASSFPLSGSSSSASLSSSTLFSSSAFSSTSTVQVLVDFLHSVPSFCADPSSGSPTSGNAAEQGSPSDPCSCSRYPRLSSNSALHPTCSTPQQVSSRVTAVRRCVSVLADLRGSEASSAALSLVPAVLLLLHRTPPSMVEGEAHTFRQVLLTLLRLVAIGVASAPVPQFGASGEGSKTEGVLSPQQEEDSSVEKEAGKPGGQNSQSTNKEALVGELSKAFAETRQAAVDCGAMKSDGEEGGGDRTPVHQERGCLADAPPVSKGPTSKDSRPCVCTSLQPRPHQTVIWFHVRTMGVLGSLESSLHARPSAGTPFHLPRKIFVTVPVPDVAQHRVAIIAPSPRPDRGPSAAIRCPFQSRLFSLLFRYVLATPLFC